MINLDEKSLKFFYFIIYLFMYKESILQISLEHGKFALVMEMWRRQSLISLVLEESSGLAN